MGKLLPVVFSSLLLLSACGGGSNSDNNKPEDSDNDTIVNSKDNCPSIANTNQLDTDNNGIGDACDDVDKSKIALQKISQFAQTAGASETPQVQDYIDAGVQGVDNTNLATVNLKVAGLSEADVDTVAEIMMILEDLGISIDDPDDDGDNHSNLNDNCPSISNPNQLDTDNDGVGDACDSIDKNENDNDNDNDNDGIDNSVDNCPNVANPDQSDLDNNGIGDACDTTDISDDDNDTVINTIDNCPATPNPDQSDSDNDGKGDVCDTLDDRDSDNDGVINSKDEFPNDPSRAASVNSAYRLLNQSTFGATEAEIDRIVVMGVDAWIEEQLNMPSAYDNASDSHKTHLQRTIEITQTVEPSIPWIQNGYAFNSGENLPIWRVIQYQMSAWWENALGHPSNQYHGSDQLRQRVAYALSQLMVVSGKDPRLDSRGDSIAYFYDILARNALGNYRTLLGEVARSATMGVYLTYQGNQKADPSKSTRPDENFARELIQLFTVGLYELNLDGSADRDEDVSTFPDAGNHQIPTYNQEDIVELAKVMTGWDTKGNSRYGRTSMSKTDYAAPMVFHPEYHEDEVAEGGDGNVTVLGKTFALNSGTDGSGMDAALNVIFQHPNIGPFVSKNLIMNLVTSNPSSAYVARVSSIFNNNGQGIKGDLKAVIRAILSDVEARETANQNQNFGKIKEPFLVFTQLLRSFNVTPLDGWKGRVDSDRGDGTSATVNGVYAYTNPEATFGQAPLRSSSVFNFYQPDYVPSEGYFSANRLVSPESQIQTDGNILNVHNKIVYHLRRYEKNRITKIDNKTLGEFAETKSIYSTLMIVNYDRELILFEQALDGDSNGDFSNMKSIPDRERAVDSLLIHLDKIMLGNNMAAEFKQKLRSYLLTAGSFNNSNTLKGAHHLISDAIRFIGTSSAFMVQK